MPRLNVLGFKGLKTQDHHILPKHFFKGDKSGEAQRFMESTENLITLTVAQHMQAHILLYGIYGCGFDKAGLSALSGDVLESQTIARLEGGQLGSAFGSMKRNGTHFYDPEKQKEFLLKK